MPRNTIDSNTAIYTAENITVAPQYLATMLNKYATGKQFFIYLHVSNIREKALMILRFPRVAPERHIRVTW